MRRALVIAILACGACGDPAGTTDPVVLRLASPTHQDGALAVRVTGTGFVTVTPQAGYRVFRWQETADTLDLLVFGNITDGPIVTVNVTNGVHLGRYAAQVTAVARRDNTVSANLDGYRVTFDRM